AYLVHLIVLQRTAHALWVLHGVELGVRRHLAVRTHRGMIDLEARRAGVAARDHADHSNLLRFAPWLFRLGPGVIDHAAVIGRAPRGVRVREQVVEDQSVIDAGIGVLVHGSPNGPR